MAPTLCPLDDPFEATVLCGYLARAFNGNAREVPPEQSPLWPVARNLVTQMRRDGYHLGAYVNRALVTQVPPPR